MPPGVKNADEAVDLAKAVAREGDGLIYKRLDPATGVSYIGQSIDEGNYALRQLSHDSVYKLEHEYEILARGRPGLDLDVLEEAHIRSNGGLLKDGGYLLNKRHQMNPSRFTHGVNFLLRDQQVKILWSNGLMNGTIGGVENFTRCER